MKKIINDPNKYLSEMLEGIYIAHQNQLTYVNDDPQCLVTKTKKAGKVGIATGGGSGHLPLFLGYVGDGMLDGCSVGDVFQSPSAEQMHAITKEIDSGAGVLYIYGNYNGDIFNFDMAAEMADFEDGIRVETVLGADDVASIGPLSQDEKTTRRGVALTSCVVPRVGHAGFHIEEDEMEIGMGIHGETGIRRGKIETADQITEEMMNKIIEDLPYAPGDRVAVLVNGLGATPLDEQYIVTRKINQLLMDKGIAVHRYYVGEYATSLEMAGVSISLLKLDEELTELIDYPANTPFFKQL